MSDKLICKIDEASDGNMFSILDILGNVIYQPYFLFWLTFYILFPFLYCLTLTYYKNDIVVFVGYSGFLHQ